MGSVTFADGCDHCYVVVYTRRWRDRLRKRYWIRCWDCDHRDGPWRDAANAWGAVAAFEDRRLRRLGIKPA